MTITPSRRVYALGTVLLASLAFCSREFNHIGAPAFLISIGISGVAYLLSVREFFSPAKLPRAVLVAGLLFAAAWHILFLRLPPGPDDDIHRYVWDGRIQRLGYNPYLVVPNDPAASNLHTPETRSLNHPDLPSPYPPGAELFFRCVMTIHQSVFALKLAFVLCETGIVWLLLDLLRRNEHPEHWVLAFVWNPLLAIEVAGSGHIDIFGALLLLISYATLARRWRSISAVALSLAISVKFLPVVLLPLYWRRVRIRDAALGVLVFMSLYLPFLDHGRIPFGSLATYVKSFRFNDPVFAMLERVADPRLITGLAVLLGLLVSIYFRRKSPDWPLEFFSWPMAASLLCAPVIYPWYLLWLLPFMLSVPAGPIIIWTVSISPVYIVWYLRSIGRPWLVPGWALFLEYGSIAIAVLISLLRLRQRAMP